MQLQDQVVTLQLVSIVATVAISVGAAAIYLTRWLDRQFSETRKLFYRVISLHNREDDDRFQALSDDIHHIHLRNARRDGDKDTPKRHTLPRRRYLLDDGHRDGAIGQGEELEFG